ncbi:MAG: trypsin-like peptidase domain-containing protein [Dehalococcoidia bacterium]|nr:trypsin-like peptidase domain-containing protein [Dehalococcoidia bacterium]
MSASVALDTRALAADGEALAARLRSILVTVTGAQGGGSGVLWGDGLVVTCNHVVPGPQARVALPSGEVADAKVSARDAGADLVALALPASAAESPCCLVGDSATLRPGEIVFAIGNPWGARGTLTAGVVACRPASVGDLGPLPDALYADVRLGPGSSGGPLADARGRVVGVCAMVAGGLAVAVPTVAVRRFLAQGAPSGRLGIRGRAVPLPPAIAASFATADGLLVTDVDDDSAAAVAGLLPGDVVLRLAGRAAGFVATARGLERLWPGVPVQLDLLRGADLRRLEASPGDRS